MLSRQLQLDPVVEPLRVKPRGRPAAQCGDVQSLPAIARRTSSQRRIRFRRRRFSQLIFIVDVDVVIVRVRLARLDRDCRSMPAA